MANQILSLYAFMRTKQLSLLLERRKKRKTYRERMIEAFDKDLFICPCCHREMDLVEKWHADYGILYHNMEGMKIIKRWEESDDVYKRRAE